MNKVCVVGGANIDICGSSLAPLKSFDSNPGTIELRYGGVGRNIAQILALLKQNVEFVTCFSADYYGQMLRKDCESLGMDCSKSVMVEGLPSSMYIAILDENNDMKIGLSDMRILRSLDENTIDRALSDLSSDDFLVIDANLSENTIPYILNHAPCRTAADPVSANKIGRIASVIGKLTVFKPNQYEAAEMTGIWIKDDETAVENLDWFLEKGVKEIIISMAERGILLGTEEGKYWLRHRTIQLDNATGGGDTFMGAYLSRRLAGENPLSAAYYGATAACIAIESGAVKNRSLNHEDIMSKIEGMQITERRL